MVVGLPARDGLGHPGVCFPLCSHPLLAGVGAAVPGTQAPSAAPWALSSRLQVAVQAPVITYDFQPAGQWLIILLESRDTFAHLLA